MLTFYKTGKRKKDRLVGINKFWRLIFAVRMKHACVLIFKNKIPPKPCVFTIKIFFFNCTRFYFMVGVRILFYILIPEM